jgi:hypothetical protein
MKNNNVWFKRKIRYRLYRRSLLMRLYYEFEELLWLGICVGILVVIVNILDLGIV